MLKQKLLSSMGAEEKLYVDDVFSTYLYTGNGSTRTINNGIDLAGEGGMVWCKSRSNGIADHYLYDTLRGRAVGLSSNTTAAQHSPSSGTQDFTGFTESGFTLGTGWNAYLNALDQTFASWTFRKAPKFFDVVTYTGDGVAGRQIPHELGVAPGMIIVKCTDAPLDWQVYHRANTADPETDYLVLNSIAATVDSNTRWNDTLPTDSMFTLGNDTSVNGGGKTYVAYLFAHDTEEDGIIQCGSYTGNGSGQVVNLGWEPQFVIVKKSTQVNTGGNVWYMFDNMRGLTIDQNNPILQAQSSAAEATASGNFVSPRPTGFFVGPGGSLEAVGDTYIYLAIRRPNKPPESGSEVYNVTNSTSFGLTSLSVPFPPDMVIERSYQTTETWWNGDRLRGSRTYSRVNTSDQELTAGSNVWGFNGASSIFGQSLNSTAPMINHLFRRAPGFFDVVCYTGNSSTVPGGDRAITHNLGVAPELAIVKIRSTAGSWAVGHSSSWAVTRVLESTSAGFTGTQNQAFTDPTSSVLNVRNNNVSNLNANGHTYVAYLFASLPGISKVGSYTGNGSSQTISCGFSTGARFILIKRTDNTGDWYVWDSARGIVAGNDPHLSLNTTAAEVTTNDSVDPESSGFIVNQVAATNINVNAATYIYFSVS